MKGATTVILLVSLTGCQTAGLTLSRYEPPPASQSDLADIGKIGPIARSPNSTPPTVSVEHDQFAAHTSYVVTPTLQQPMEGEGTIVRSWGRSVITLAAFTDDSKRGLSIGAKIQFQHMLKSWMMPSRASDENGKALEAQRTKGDVDCSKYRCEYDETFMVMLNEADLRRAGGSGQPYRFKVYGDGRQEIISIPANYISGLFSQLPVSRASSGRGKRT